MKSLDEFLKSINPYAPGCAIPTAYYGIRQAAIEFCERTRLWRYEDEFTVTVADSEAITTPFGSVLLDIETVTFDGGRPLVPKTTDWLDENCAGWRDGSVTGVPQYLTQTDLNTIRLVPGQAGTVKISVWLKPSQDCTEVPDFLPDQYREVIAFGALGRILMTPSQPYTNGNLATAFLSQFEGKLSAMSHKGIAGQQRAITRTKGNFL